MSCSKDVLLASEVDITIRALRDLKRPFSMRVLGQVKGMGNEDGFYQIRRLAFNNIVILEQMVRMNDCDLSDVLTSREFSLQTEPKDWPIEIELNPNKIGEVDDPIVKEIGIGKNRPSWEEYFLSIAKVVSSRASCPRASVGAVVVDQYNHILSTGYNGAPSGKPSCLEVGCQLEQDHCVRVLHAEINALAHAARVGIVTNESTIHIYDSGNRSVPCHSCAQVIIAAGVKRICLNGKWIESEALV